MKKFLSMTLLLTAMFLTFSSCSKDDDNDEGGGRREEVTETTYTFSFTADDPSSQGITTDITLFEYNDKGERVSQKHVKDCRKGHTETFKANFNSQKVKVYITNSKGSQSLYRWVQQVYYLEKGKNVSVAVTGETRIGTTEP